MCIYMCVCVCDDLLKTFVEGLQGSTFVVIFHGPECSGSPKKKMGVGGRGGVGIKILVLNRKLAWVTIRRDK